MRAETLLFWLVVLVAFGTAGALVWFGYWPFAIPLAVAAVAHLLAPRPEPRKEKGEGASSHVFSFRRELLFIVGCLLVVVIAAYR